MIYLNAYEKKFWNFFKPLFEYMSKIIVVIQNFLANIINFINVKIEKQGFSKIFFSPKVIYVFLNLSHNTPLWCKCNVSSNITFLIMKKQLKLI